MIADSIRDILANEPDFNYRADVDNDTSLMEAGVVDSFAMITLVVLIEERFGIKVRPEDMSPEAFSTISSIDHYIRGQLNETPSS